MNEHGGERHPTFAHVAPLKALFGTFGGLLVLTIVTVAVTYVDLGALNLWVALLIAGFKATLVAMFFMHLWWDRRFNAFVLICGLAFVVLFIGFALLDTSQYKPDLIPGYAPAVNQ